MVEVSVSHPLDPENPLEETHMMRVWLGFLAPDLVAALQTEAPVLFHSAAEEPPLLQALAAAGGSADLSSRLASLEEQLGKLSSGVAQLMESQPKPALPPTGQPSQLWS